MKDKPLDIDPTAETSLTAETRILYSFHIDTNVDPASWNDSVKMMMRSPMVPTLELAYVTIRQTYSKSREDKLMVGQNDPRVSALNGELLKAYKTGRIDGVTVPGGLHVNRDQAIEYMRDVLEIRVGKLMAAILGASGKRAKQGSTPGSGEGIFKRGFKR